MIQFSIGEQYERRLKHHKSIGTHWYPKYAVQKFGLRVGIKQICKYWVLPILTLRFVTRKVQRWKKKDKRRKGYSQTKFAIDRDGDLFMVECPSCLWQDVWYWDKYHLFHCNWCDIWFSVYTEDGVRKLKDHRKGNANLPNTTVFDPGSKINRLGIDEDAPWWWDRREIYRDLQRNGKDAHGHKKYKVVDKPLQMKENIGQCESKSP